MPDRYNVRDQFFNTQNGKYQKESQDKADKGIDGHHRKVCDTL